ncbi:MAG: hypothetical protein EP344_17600 [Bacteroidetes bacterium]|nr:MAG: hypothetical protein EP344_17600 [Bacteroidota bacterium]
MLNRLLLPLLLLLTCSTVQGQEAFGKLVAGLEVGFDVNQFTAGIKPRLIPGFQVEVPVGRFSFGVGIGNEIYHEYEYYTYAGQTIERIENEKPVPYYVSDLHAFRPSYWSVPIKVDYRFHRCYCVFVHAGITFDFFNDRPEDRIVFQGAELRERPLDEVRREQLFKKNTKSYEIGVGFKLHSNDYIRLVARPSFVLSENPEIYTDGPKYLPTLRMNFGFQYAFIRYE